jgi:type IV secretory pathway VirB4 component
MNPTQQPTYGAASSNGASAKTSTNPNSTQNTLQISEIRDGIVIMSDGSFRAVIMCKSINFDLMSPQEREAVEFSYQGFLNSLYFPVQIFVRSQKVDLRPYLERMDKIRTSQDNMLLALLMEDYIAFLADIAQQTNIMDKKFYVVIKYPDSNQDIRKALKQSTGFFGGLLGMFSSSVRGVVIDENTLETAKTELKNRVQAVMQGLAQAGIQSLPLDTEELIELYYDAYNPDTATRQQVKDFNKLTAPVVSKGEGNAPQPGLDAGVA